MSLALLSSIVAVCMAVGVMFLRFKSAKKPVTKKKIILPPIFMSTGAMMYFLRVSINVFRNSRGN